MEEKRLICPIAERVDRWFDFRGVELIAGSVARIGIAMYFIPTPRAAAATVCASRPGAISMNVLKPRRHNSEIAQSLDCTGPPLDAVPSIGK
jgi:hypothetical protein